MTRQQRRAAERRADKPRPGTISRTSTRWLARRTKGQPFRNHRVTRIEPAEKGKPAVFHVKCYTRKSNPPPIEADFLTIDWFMPNLPANLKETLAGL